MDTATPNRGSRRFSWPERHFGGLSPEAAGELLARAADVALIVDAQGVVSDVAVSNDDLPDAGFDTWIGRPWEQIVTQESRRKVADLIRDADRPEPRWRQINHPTAAGPDLPLRYIAVRVGEEGGPTLAVGRDLSAAAELQQRVVELQQALERDYERLRQVETRYRALFQLASEPVLIVDVATRRVSEANPAASELIHESLERLQGKHVLDLFETSSAEAIDRAFVAARASGRTEAAEAKLARTGEACAVAVSLFRHGRVSSVLLRLSPSSKVVRAPNASGRAAVPSVFDAMPDGLVVTDGDLRIQVANAAFLELVQALNEEDARDRSLEDFVGRTGVDLSVLVANVREHGAVRNFSSQVRGRLGARHAVEIAAVCVEDAEGRRYGFTFREADGAFRSAGPGVEVRKGLTESVQQLTDLVGRVSLKEIVRDTTDLIERLCIEAALELTGDNRASAAEILGLSRQSLYSKLNRFGLAGRADDV